MATHSRSTQKGVVGKMNNNSSKSGTLLMSVIRTLSASENYEQREIEKANLEREFKLCDQELNRLVKIHYEDLSTQVQSFSRISGKVQSARAHVRHIREELASCKALLHCRRDELRKLWIEGCEQRQCLALMDQIEEIRDIPEKIEGHTNKKQYLHATELLVSSVKQLDGDLKDVEALRDLRSDVQEKKLRLYSSIIEDIQRHVYIRSTGSVLTRYGSERFDRSVSERQSVDKLSRSGSDRLSGRQVNVVVGGRVVVQPQGPTLQPVNNKLDLPVYPPSEEVPDKVQESLIDDPDTDSATFITTCIHSLATLEKVHDGMEDIVSQIEREASMIVARSTQQILDMNYHDQGQDAPASLMLDLLDLVFKQFRCVVTAHQHVINSVLRCQLLPEGERKVYGVPQVWSKLQKVLQFLLRDYLDVKNSNATSQQQLPSSFPDTPVHVASYFAKRRTQKPKKVALFRFDASSHALSMSSFLREQRYNNGALDELPENLQNQQFVCTPSAKNITVVFTPLNKYIKEIEDAVDGDGNECTLRKFIADFIRTIFLGQVHFEVSSRIDQATKVTDAWKAVIASEVQKELGVPRPLLESCKSVEEGIAELSRLMYSLPEYADQFLTMICTILQEYREVCQAAYRDIVQPESDDKRVISATWAKDEDINRFLRSLPNWLSLQEGMAAAALEETSEEVKRRHAKETDILTGNLGDTLIPQHEILADVNQLKTLASLQESLTWFAERLRCFSKNLPHVASTSPPHEAAASEPPLPVVAKTLVETLENLTKEFEELAETCLLVLHLEVRVHCFFYLMPIAKQPVQGGGYSGGVDSIDPDTNVARLTRDLASVEDAMATSLQPHKFKYIFEGIGHLIASILVNSAQYLRKINENGIKKMCRNIFSIQQTLTNITTSREADLEHARQYYEMLSNTPEDIISGIKEAGEATFTELEYMNALNLLHRSHVSPNQEMLQHRLHKLKSALEEVAKRGRQQQQNNNNSAAAGDSPPAPALTNGNHTYVAHQWVIAGGGPAAVGAVDGLHSPQQPPTPAAAFAAAAYAINGAS